MNHILIGCPWNVTNGSEATSAQIVKDNKHKQAFFPSGFSRFWNLFKGKNLRRIHFSYILLWGLVKFKFQVPSLFTDRRFCKHRVTEKLSDVMYANWQFTITLFFSSRHCGLIQAAKVMHKVVFSEVKICRIVAEVNTILLIETEQCWMTAKSLNLTWLKKIEILVYNIVINFGLFLDLYLAQKRFILQAFTEALMQINSLHWKFWTQWRTPLVCR